MAIGSRRLPLMITFQRDEAVRVPMLGIRLVTLALGFSPVPSIEVGEIRITIDTRVHFGQINPIGTANGLCVNVTSADDEYFHAVGDRSERVGERMGHDAAGGVQCAARYDAVM